MESATAKHYTLSPYILQITNLEKKGGWYDNKSVQWVYACTPNVFQKVFAGVYSGVLIIFFYQNIDCRYLLMLLWWGGSEEHPESMFGTYKKNTERKTTMK